jgi:hypothetical protein
MSMDSDDKKDNFPCNEILMQHDQNDLNYLLGQFLEKRDQKSSLPPAQTKGLT